jgi:hypothetical protein
MAATVVFPQPDTPMKTSTTGFAIGVEIEESRSLRMRIVMLGPSGSQRPLRPGDGKVAVADSITAEPVELANGADPQAAQPA